MVREFRKNSWIIYWYIVTRLILIIIGYYANINTKMIRPDQPWGMPNLPLIFTMWDRQDSQWYLEIAKRGYNFMGTYGMDPHAFFPLYPILITITHHLGIDRAIGSLFISNISFIVVLYFLHNLVKKYFGNDVAWLSIIIMLVFPTSYYFSSIYTESLFLLCGVLVFWFADREKWYLAGLSGFFAALTRNIGVILALPLSIVIWNKYKYNISKYMPVLLIPLGLFSWCVYLYFTTGDALAFIHAENSTIVNAWSRTLTNPIYGFIHVLLNLNKYNPVYIFLDFGSIIFSFIMIYLGYKYKQNISWTLYSLIGLLIPMSNPTFKFITPYASMSRYIIVLFPIFVSFAQYIDKRFTKKYLYIILLMIFQCLLFIRFTTWIWVA